MKDEFYGKDTFYGTWKTKKFWMCKEPGMTLWMALDRMRRTTWYSDWSEVNKSIPIEVFPYDLTTDCKCKDCRYTRWRKRRG